MNYRKHILVELVFINSCVFVFPYLSSQGEALETVTTAAVCLFGTQTQLADQVPPLGHLPRVLSALNHKNNAVPKSAIRLIHVLSDNEVQHTLCVFFYGTSWLKLGCDYINHVKIQMIYIH